MLLNEVNDLNASSITSMRGEWLPALLSTLVTLPAALLAYFFAGLSPMACDSCNGAVADRFTQSYDTAFPVLVVGIGASLVMLLLSWSLPWEQRNVVRRRCLAALAPATVVLAYLLFLAVVDWPN